MKRFMKYFIIIVGAALFSTVIHAQTNSSKTVIARENLRFSGESPDTNKIAVSMDALGNVKWVYFSDFQDSINTGVYDTLIVDSIFGRVGFLQTVRVNRDSFTDPAATIASVSDSGNIVECFTCDTIQLLLDSTYNSPWTYNTGGNIVQRDTTLNVGIGTNSPSAAFHVVDGLIQFKTDSVYYFDKSGTSNGNVTGLVGSGFKDAVIGIIPSNPLGVFTFAPVIYSNNGREQFYLQDGIRTILSVANIGVDTSTINITAGGITFTNPVSIQDGTEADGYILTSDASGKATWQDPNVETGTGWVSINDTYYTVANPFVVAAGDTANFPNRGNTSTQTQLPFGVDSLYNRADSSLIAITAGDAYLLRITFVAENTNSSGVFEIFIDIGTGGTRTLILASTEALASGPNIKNTYTFTYPYFAGATFVANGGRVLIRSVVGTTKISHINYFIERTYKAN